MGHGHMDENVCSMDMLFTWNTTNLCIVFRQWHIHSTASLVFSLLAVVLLGIGYEALRTLSRRYDTAASKHINALPSDGAVTEDTPFHAPGQNQAQANYHTHLVKAVLYTLQNFYVFMLMLVFMTYNGWVMIAVSVGAFLGCLLFGHTTAATKDNACH
ncbi:Copper transport protein [Fusarium sp. LHS14.1]|nr:Copper transport protein [Fusarium sp. LHS14.1]